MAPIQRARHPFGHFVHQARPRCWRKVSPRLDGRFRGSAADGRGADDAGRPETLRGGCQRRPPRWHLAQIPDRADAMPGFPRIEAPGRACPADLCRPIDHPAAVGPLPAVPQPPLVACRQILRAAVPLADLQAVASTQQQPVWVPPVETTLATSTCGQTRRVARSGYGCGVTREMIGRFIAASLKPTPPGSPLTRRGPVYPAPAPALDGPPERDMRIGLNVEGVLFGHLVDG
jgi:hypothetical protein